MGGEIEAAISERPWLQWALLGVLVLGLFAFVSTVRLWFCPPKGSRAIAISLSMLVSLCGLGLVALAVYALYYDYDFFSNFVGKTSIYVSGGIGVALAAIGVATLLGIACRSPSMMGIVALVVLVMVIAEVCGVVFIAYWVWSLTDIEADSLATLHDSSSGRWDGRFGATALAEIEGFVCRTYTKCCRDPALDRVAGGAREEGSGFLDFGSGSPAQPGCYSIPEGESNDMRYAAQDPGAANFCLYVSGSSESFEPDDGACDALDAWLDGFSIAQCQSDFCTLGVDGYGEFVTLMVEFVQRNIIAIGGAGALLALFQLVLLMNVWNLRKTFKDETVMMWEPHSGKLVEAQTRRGKVPLGRDAIGQKAWL